jgi:hypothetical protein
VRGGNRQQAALLGHEFLAGFFEVAALQQQALDDRQHMGARLGQAGQALAGAHKQFNAELFFQFADLPADPGLRGVQGIGDVGQVEVASHGLAHGTQLLEVHGGEGCGRREARC